MLYNYLIPNLSVFIDYMCKVVLNRQSTNFKLICQIQHNLD